jgi:ABC-type nitrate/sulfonate/bicarbonate transport system substrate-binding protein
MSHRPSVVNGHPAPEPTGGEAADIWYARCGGATASTIAIQRGWLEEEFIADGLRIQAVQSAEQRTIRDSHFDHRLPAMFREGGNIPPIWAKSAGQDTVVLGITWVDEWQGILVREDSPIRSIEQLKGKRLGAPRHDGSLTDFGRGMALHGFDTAFRVAGLDVLRDATFVDIVAQAADHRGHANREVARFGADTREAVLRGEVDAIYAKGGWGGSAARAGLRQIFDINELADPTLRINNGTPRPITVGRSFLARHPERVERYLAVLLRTGRWAAEHPNEILADLAAESGSDTAAVIHGYGANVHRHLIPSLSEEYVAGLTLQKDWLRDWGFLAADFHVADWIVREPLAAAERLIDAGRVLV